MCDPQVFLFLFGNILEDIFEKGTFLCRCARYDEEFVEARQSEAISEIFLR